MSRRETTTEREGRLKLEALLEAIRTGEVDAIEDLKPDEVAMLMTQARKDEAFEDLFDRLRPQMRER
jgi:hypothetical protein